MYNLSSYAIITPTHKSKLSKTEEIRIRLTIESNKSFFHFFVLPQSQNSVFFRKKFPNSKIIFFDDKFFKSFNDYNLLLLLPIFYEKFLEFKKIIICQPDAFIFRKINPNSINNFAYLGASWNPIFIISEFFNTIFVNRKSLILRNNHELESGNGGLSVRDPLVIYKLLLDMGKSKKFIRIIYNNRKINEDLMVVFLLKKIGISPVPKIIADQYFIENTNPIHYDIQKVLGFHALAKYNPKLESLLLSKYTE
jgi:hypothetical protein